MVVIPAESVVTEFRLINPHALMTMEVTDDSGKVVKWVVEFAGRLNLTEGGWNERTITPGQKVTVTGTLDAKTKTIKVEKIEAAK